MGLSLSVLFCSVLANVLFGPRKGPDKALKRGPKQREVFWVVSECELDDKSEKLPVPKIGRKSCTVLRANCSFWRAFGRAQIRMRERERDEMLSSGF